MKIINNFLEKEDFNLLKTSLMSNTFPWYFQDGVVTEKDGNVHLIHNFYKNYSIHSHLYNLVIPIVEKLNPLSLIRIKTNLLLKTDKIIEHGLHIDQSIKNNNKAKTAILYCNNNNGYTKFEDNKKIISEENKIVIFNNNLKHTGSTCTDEKVRIVININYIER